MKNVIMMAASLSTIGNFRELAIMATDVPREVMASERLSLAAASRALDFTLVKINTKHDDGRYNPDNGSHRVNQGFFLVDDFLSRINEDIETDKKHDERSN